MEDNDNKNNIVNISVITFNTHHLNTEIEKSSTFSDLKNKIITIDPEIPDFSIIVNGRVVRNMDDPISSHISDDKATIYLNGAQVHGGCCPNYCK